MATNRKPITKLSSTVFPYRGKYRIQYFDAQGRIRTKTAETLKDAYKDLALLEQMVASGLHSPVANNLPTLSEWLSAWYESRKSEVSPSTLWNFESTIRLHINPHLGHLRLDKVSALQIERLYAYLSDNKGLSQGSIYKVHATLSHAFGAALKGKLLVTSPLKSIRAPRVHKKAIETLSGQEVRRILRVAHELGPEAEVRWLLSLRLGLRQGEALALLWSDIDLEQGTLKVNKSVNSLPGQGLVFSTPKSSQSNRTLPLDAETHGAIKRYYLFTSNVDAGTLLFPTRQGAPREASSDYRAWKRLLNLAEVREVRLHDARHSAATLMLAGGADIRSIQLLLGHATPAFTMATYLHPDSDKLRTAIELAALQSQFE